MTIRVTAPAKVNLTLNVTGRRDDGYHTLVSFVVFTPDIADELEVRPSPSLSLSVSGPTAQGIPVDQSNIVLKAAQLMRRLRNVSAGAQITLHKHLPNQAGIGGGSSDAAAVIHALSTLWQVAPLDGSEALELGADVPVCLAGPSPQIMEDIGSQVSPARHFLPENAEPALVLINTGEKVPTGQLFEDLRKAGLVHRDPSVPMLDASVDAFANWLRAQRNDLTDPAKRIAPTIETAMAQMAKQTGVLARGMSGSGATVWGLCANAEVAQSAAREIQDAEPGWWVRSGRIAR